MLTEEDKKWIKEQLVEQIDRSAYCIIAFIGAVDFLTIFVLLRLSH